MSGWHSVRVSINRGYIVHIRKEPPDSEVYLGTGVIGSPISIQPMAGVHEISGCLGNLITAYSIIIIIMCHNAP